MKTRRTTKRVKGGNNETINLFFSILEQNNLQRLYRFFEENPDFDVNSKKNGENALFYVLRGTLQYDSEDMIHALIDHGLDVKARNAQGWTAMFILARYQVFEEMADIANLLLDAGLDINDKANNGANIYNIIVRYAENISLETFRLLLDLGLDFMYEYDYDSAMMGFLLNYPDEDLIMQVFNSFPSVTTAIFRDDFSYLQKYLFSESFDLDQIGMTIHQFVVHGANLSAQYFNDETALHSLIDKLNDFNTDGLSINVDKCRHIIQYMLEHGADPTLKNKVGKTAYDLAIHLDDRIKELLVPSSPPEIWAGWTRADIAHMDDIFNEAIPTNTNLTGTTEEESLFSMCPVCLKYIQHEPRTCMYMSHNCKALGEFYHRDLYEKYKFYKINAFGEPMNEEIITWCTLCGRICKGHQHYAIAAWDSSDVRLMAPGRPYEVDCRVTNGGGGKPEKLARFRRLREFVFEDMNDLAGTVTKYEAYTQMVQEMWNAPLVSRPARIRQIETSKQWNIPSSEFPAPVTTATTNTNASNIPYTGQLPLIHPVETEEFKNAFSVDDENILQFRHGGNQHAGRGQQVSRTGFVGFLKNVLGDPRDPRFGKCWQYSTPAQLILMTPEQRALACNETLHPDEVRAALDMTNPEQASLYEGYRKQFNRKFGH